MASKKKANPAKIGKVMHEFKTGTLHSGKGGPVVKSRKQAVAIAMSEARMSKPKKKATPKSGVKHERKESASKKRTERKTGRS